LLRRFGLAVAALNGHLYAFGGEDTDESAEETFGKCTVEAFCPVMNRWRRVADMTAERCVSGAVAHNGRIYVVDSFDSSMEVYEPTTNSWSRQGCAPMLTPRTEGAVALS